MQDTQEYNTICVCSKRNGQDVDETWKELADAVSLFMFGVTVQN